MFRIGGWWYLVFSEYRDVWSTHYRMARSPQGPWLTPADDGFDERAYYAAKTVSDGTRRFIAGWLCTKEGQQDGGKYEWGGSLMVHELLQRQDGTLGAGLPKEVEEAYTTACELTPQPEMGQWRTQGDALVAQGRSEFCFARLAELPEEFTFHTTMRWQPNTRSLGISLRAGKPLADGYMVSIEPERRMLKFDRWLRAWDTPWMERPLVVEGDQAELQVIMAGSEIAIYVNGTVALSGRAYDLKGGSIGLFVSEGEGEFSECRLMTRREAARE